MNTQSRPVKTPSLQVPPPTVKTEPLKEFKQEIKPFNIPPAPSVNPYSLPQNGGEEMFTLPDTVKEEPPLSAPKAPIQKEVPKEEPEPQVLTPFEPIEPPASSSPAIGSLVIAANENNQIGNVESAVSSIERAIRIQPRNPALYYKLALLRLKQSKPRLAEDLARKSALLAAGDARLKKHSWLLIAHARELQKDFKGAKVARAKADKF